jgi:ketosteroid isomerase-like protein
VTATPPTRTSPIVGHIPGRSALAGDVRGRDAIRGYIETVLAGTDRHEVELIDMLSGKEHVALVVRERFRSGDRELDMRRANVYRVEDDKITEIWIFEGDQYAVDEFLAEL